MADYIYQFNGQESGPLSFVELATQLAASELTADTLVRSQDANDWMAAEDVPGLVRAAKKIAATFPETNSNVATSQPVVLTGINVSMDNVDNAQWLSNTTIKFAVGDLTYTRRSQHVAERSDTDGTFNVTSQIPLQNPWPRMSFSSEFARAYFANASGLSITAPKLQIEKFGLGLILLDSEAIGPIDDAMDDPVFVVPQEDIVFYKRQKHFTCDRQCDGNKKRFAAAAYWGGPDKNVPGPHHNWVVEILPLIDRRDLADRWDHGQLLNFPSNQALAEHHVKVLACPSDYTTDERGDLSYALDGGIGESTILNGVQDCIVDPFNQVLDLNGNGQTCLGSDIDDGSPSDRDVYFHMGLFFNENWGYENTPGYKGTKRFHTTATVVDGMSNTLMVAENVRTGFDPNTPNSNWASSDSRRTKFYFSNTICRDNICVASGINLSLANSGDHAINSGRFRAEDESPWPNSFHPGGVCVSFADGRAQFLNEHIAGRVFYNLMTPQGLRLAKSPLDGGVLSDNEY